MLRKSKGWKKEKDKHNVINLTGKISVNHLGTMSLEPTQMFKKKQIAEKEQQSTVLNYHGFLEDIGCFSKEALC